MSYEFERTLARLTTGRDLHYGDWKRGQMAGAQIDQRHRNGDMPQSARSLNEPRRG